MHQPPQPTSEVAEELLRLVGWEGSVTSMTARHELARRLGWSVYWPEFREARSQLLELNLITYDAPPGGNSDLELTDEGWDVLESRET